MTGISRPRIGTTTLRPDKFFVALIQRMDGNGGISQDRFRAGGGNRYEIARPGQHVFKIIERAGFFVVFNFQVADGGLQPGRPVDEARAAVDESLLIQAHKCFTDSFRQTLVEGETLAFPVAGGADLADLAGNDLVVFRFPRPDPFHKFLAPEFFACDFLGSQQVFFNLQLGGDSGMIRTGHPQGRGYPSCGGSGSSSLPLPRT